MKKKVLALSASPRWGGNSEAVADAFLDIYLLASAADGDENAMEVAVKGLEGWISCFDRAKLSGVVRGVGLDIPGAIQAHPALLEKVAQMGQSL